MSDFIIVGSDTARFMPAFGAAIVAVQPGIISGSGRTTFTGKKLCVEGDERSVMVAGCTYMTPQYPLPGIGTLKIASLASTQVATKTASSGKAVILKGTHFKAVFEVQSPAMQPATPPVPDATPQYLGQGIFVTSNTKFLGT